MPVSKAQKEATKRFEEKNYDKVLLRLRKDDLSKEQIQNAAEKCGESINGYVVNAIKMRIKSANISAPSGAEQEE